ncbi:MAG TPA: class II glutamine amidotransferase [Solirubrobacteraceae bacterium]|nr:class II glutamine amidotransferase [Solirubrobacteraceae bacterium]
MCRLFGLSAGREPVSATFWLLDAPDSLAVQSHREPDGTGLGTFDERGRPVVFKQPVAAYSDRAFAARAREVRSRTFIAHIRFASTGAVSAANTHPFEQRGRLFAHNGVIGEPERIDAELGAERALVHGETDSERFFALITREIERGRPVGEAIAAAAHWVASRLPVLSLNCILTTATELWALRYPEAHELHYLRRQAGAGAGEPLEHRSRSAARIAVRSEHLRRHPSVVVASEPMDGDPGWRALDAGQLLHVAEDLAVRIQTVIDRPPAHRLTLAELEGRAAESQA